MKLRFEQIERQGCRIELDDKRLFLQEEEVDVELAGVLVFSRRSEDVVLRGELRGHLVGRCSFCAVDVPFSFAEQLGYRFVVGEDVLVEEREVDCRSGELETFFLSVPEIEVDEVLQEQVYLNLPLQLLCRQDCRGLCSGCGANLNNEQCTCDGVQSASPFAVLGKLKK